MFGQSDVTKLNDLISRGVISQSEVSSLRREFNKFASGVKTPIETAKAGKYTFEHIISKHIEMRNFDSIQSIRMILENPTEVYLTKDMFGNEANMYLSDKHDKIVLVRNNIVTAYRPTMSYLKKQKERGKKIW